MSTKVKGDAIKEGSIPLSALSNEVKDKIENAGGGADWNAQEGEAGYIENKPFGIKYCPWDSNDGEYSISGNKLMVTYPWFTSIMFKEPKFDYGLCVFDKDGNDYSETISDYDIAIFFDVTYVQSTHTLTIECSEGNIEDFIDCIKPTYVNHIEIDYIDSVIKTTPQTLSDDAKNQALANLGIPRVLNINIYGIEDNLTIDELSEILGDCVTNEILILGLCYRSKYSTVYLPTLHQSYTDFDGRKILNKLVCGQYRVDEDSYDFHLVVYPSVYLYYDEDTQNYRYFLEEY